MHKGIIELVDDSIKKGKILDVRTNKKSESLSVMTDSQRIGNITEQTLKKNVARFQKDVKAFRENNKINYSERDSDGNDLSAGQQEYFKDSVIRDGDGNLLKVY